ncbi:homoserine O-acetyltransferase MetX [Pseudothauera rhizosphaerae]|uniref:Homoserine O-acetyltransferase n=1 Tax=Pseudothauera rhizosphaerae TaxID=2565932 RepID=A0A4V3WBZ6_9RHOO|nr:homoserine O-acetyltransferase [Pseudothauera rhizosphaerae]THF65162.1 homoserine O-acetyltransferase [Pseudothauera rhizosphaerae]
MTGFPLSRETRRLVLDQPFLLESGVSLPGLEIAWRSWGRLAPAGDNAVVVCHALTGSADADNWWAPLFGPGRVLDPQRDFIVCSNVLGGCYGSTGPTSPAPDGRPWGGRFPALTVRDQVRAQIALADALGIRRIALVLGGSMGGLQALEWALLDPERVDAVATIAASGRHSAWCAVWSEAQRQALATDPKYRDGHYDPADPPHAGLAAARAMAMVSYRSPASLASRFGRASGAEAFGDRAHSPGELAARGWLRHHGKALVERFDAHTYRMLIDAMDSHDLARGRGDYETVLRGIRQPVLVGSIASDALYVPADQFELVRLIPRAELLTIDSQHGHDGFLIDAANFQRTLREFKERHAPRAFPAPARRHALPAVHGRPSARSANACNR